MHDARSKRMYCRPRQTCMHEQDDPGRTRTCNPQLRRPMPYPLGHGANDRRDLNSPTLTDSQQACACVPACLRARARDNLSEPTRGHRHPCCAQRLSTYGSCNSRVQRRCALPGPPFPPLSRLPDCGACPLPALSTHAPHERDEGTAFADASGRHAGRRTK